MKKLLAPLVLALLTSASAQSLRVIVLVDDRGYGWWYNNGLSTASAAITEVLMKENFAVIDGTAVNGYGERGVLTAALGGDTNAAARLAQNFKADVVILGQGGADEVTSVGLLAGFLRARLFQGITNLRAINVANGQIIATSTGNTAGAGLSALGSDRDAIKNASALAAQQLVPALRGVSATNASAAAVAAVTTRVVIKNVASFAASQAILRELGTQPGVTKVERKAFGDGTLEIEVSGLNGDGVAGLLEGLKETRLGVTGLNGNTVEATVR